MVELKDHQQQETEGKLQFHSCLTLMAQALVPCWIQVYPPPGRTVVLENNFEYLVMNVLSLMKIQEEDW